MKRFLTPMFLLIVVGSMPTSASAAWTVTKPQLPGYEAGAVVDDGRVWWLEYRQTENWPVVRIASRALRGGPVRRVRPPLEALARPDQLGPFPEERTKFGHLFSVPFVNNFRVRDGQALLLGGWRADTGSQGMQAPSETAKTGLLAEFDGKTGALARQQAPQVRNQDSDLGVRLLPGNPATVSTNELAGIVLSNPRNDLRFAGQGTFVAGDFVRRFSAASPTTAPDVVNEAKALDAWSRGKGYLEVSDLASGTVRYRLTARRIARRAGASGAGAYTELLQDGSLAVTVSGRRGRSLAPVYVDSKGRVARLGRSIRNATGVTTRVVGQRAIVAADIDRRVRGKWRRCSDLWVTNRTGTRGRRIPTTVERAINTMTYWDGRYLVSLDYARNDSSRVQIRVDRFDRLRLSRSDLPRCR